MKEVSRSGAWLARDQATFAACLATILELPFDAVPRPAARGGRASSEHRDPHLNGLVGSEFTIGKVRCRGMRLCEPCVVVERYSSRSILRPLVHRGGLRADLLDEGTIRVGDPIQAG